jgi:hypothetical protein
MAFMIPSDNEAFNTEGERQFYNFLMKIAKPDADYVAWYTPNINDNEPDFLLYVHNLGLIVFEVKDWALEQIQEINPKQFKLTLGANSANGANGIRSFIISFSCFPISSSGIIPPHGPPPPRRIPRRPLPHYLPRKCPDSEGRAKGTSFTYLLLSIAMRLPMASKSI